MTWTAVGAPITAVSVNSPLNFNITASAVGNILVAMGTNPYGTFPDFLTLSGGPVTTWVGGIAADSGHNTEVGIWFGVVTTTATTATTLGEDSNSCEVIVQEFSYSGAGALAWDLASVVHANLGAGATSGNYPSCSPSSLDELYVGAAYFESTPGGASAGFTYIGVAGRTAQMVYKTNVDSSGGSLSPAWTQSTLNPGALAARCLGVAASGSGFFNFFARRQSGLYAPAA